MILSHGNLEVKISDCVYTSDIRENNIFSSMQIITSDNTTYSVNGDIEIDKSADIEDNEDFARQLTLASVFDIIHHYSNPDIVTYSWYGTRLFENFSLKFDLKFNDVKII